MVEHALPHTSATVRAVLLAQLDHLASQAPLYTTVDRGHRHIGTQRSEVAIWLSVMRPAARPHAPPYNGPGDDGDPDHGPRDGGYGPSNRPRRGRSPPTSHGDPWQYPGADPWASAVRPTPASPPQKAPRRQTATLTWDSWRPSLSSVTPDPPMLRLPRILPARTGTPLLEQADGMDGSFVSTGIWIPPARDDGALYAASSSLTCDARSATAPAAASSLPSLDEGQKIILEAVHNARAFACAVKLIEEEMQDEGDVAHDGDALADFFVDEDSVMQNMAHFQIKDVFSNEFESFLDGIAAVG